MITTRLPNGRTTNRIAFGCGSLGGSLGYRGSYRCLAAAYDSGFSHFDVAPSYGLGEAESMLGRFLRENRCTDATVTTKAGINGPSGQYKYLMLARSAVRPALAMIPSLQRRLGDRARRSQARGDFGIPRLQASLDDSLKKLRREHIDIYLMHELDVDDINDDLVAFLVRAKELGKIGTYGLGSRIDRAQRILAKYPQAMPVVQTGWSPFDTQLPNAEKAMRNFYGVFANISATQSRLQSDEEYSAAFQMKYGSVFPDDPSLWKTLLHAALNDSGEGLVIVSSKNLNRIAQIGQLMSV